MGDSIEPGSSLPGGTLPGPGGYMDMVGSLHPWASKPQGSCALPGETTLPCRPKQSVICSPPHHNQVWELAEGVCLDSPCMEAGCLLFHGEAPGVLGQSGHSGAVATCCPEKALGLSFSPYALEFSSLLTRMLVRKASLTCPGLTGQPKACPDHLATTTLAGLSSHRSHQK